MNTCHTTDAGLSGVCVSGCWICGLLKSKKFWLCFIATFIFLALFEWVWHMQVMAGDYRDTAVMWRPAHEMKLWLFYLADAIKAFAFTFLILAAMRTARWIDALSAGVKLGLLCVAGAIVAWNTMPFATMNVPVKWGVGGFIEAVLAAVVIHLVNSCVCKTCEKKKVVERA